MKRYLPAFFITFLLLCVMWTVSVGAAELFPVSQNRKWGYIDSQGKTVVEHKYDSAGAFEYGVATAWDNDGIYILGDDGQVILSLEKEAYIQIDGTGIYSIYDSATDYYGLNGALIGESILKLEGRFTKDYAAYWYNEQGSYEVFIGFVDKTGSVVIPAKYSAVATYESSENFVVREPGGSWKLININGETIAEYPEGYNVHGRFNIGDMFAMTDKEGLAGYYSLKTGELVLPHKYIRGEYFRDDRAIVAETSGLGVINQKGEYVIPPNYNNVYPLGEGLFGANTYNGSRVILDGNGKILLERKDGQLYFPSFKHGYTTYFADGKTYFVGTDGKVKHSVQSLTAGVIMSDSIAIIDDKYINFTTGETIYDQNQITADGLTINWITEGKDYDSGGWYPALYQNPVVSGYKDVKVNGKINSVLKNAFVDEGVFKLGNYHTGGVDTGIFGKIGYFRNILMVGVYSYEMNYHSISACVNMQTGKVYKLTDLLMSGYEERLTELVRKADSRWESSRFELDESAGFGLYDEGLIIFMHISGIRVTDPGEYVDIRIPFAEIDDIINKNGEMWYSLKYTDTANLTTQELNFTDLPIEHWATVFVQDANYNGIIFGDTKNGKPVFRPNDSLKYTEAVAMAVRAMKLPAANSKLASIDQTKWYAEEINKAHSAGLLEGISFNETADITRIEMFMVLSRGIKGVAPDKDVVLQSFTDCGNLSEAELDAASICYKAGVIIGSEGKLNPNDLLTRAEIAKIIVFLRF